MWILDFPEECSLFSTTIILLFDPCYPSLGSLDNISPAQVYCTNLKYITFFLPSFVVICSLNKIYIVIIWVFSYPTFFCLSFCLYALSFFVCPLLSLSPYVFFFACLLLWLSSTFQSFIFLFYITIIIIIIIIIIELTHSKTTLENTVEIEPQPLALDFKNLSQYFSQSK